MIPDNELLAMACEFDVGYEPLVNGRFKWWERKPSDASSYKASVRNVGNPDSNQPDRWAILRNGGSFCLNKLGEWEYQTIPSNRAEEFYARCRFASAQEAIAYYRKWFDHVAKWAEEKGGDRLNYEDCPEFKFE